jgi:hypothetical protein
MAQIDPNEPCPCGSGKPFRECHGPLVRTGQPTISQHVALQVVPKPAPGSAAVFEHRGDGTQFIQASATTISYDCGSCSSSLMAGVEIEQIVGVVLKCAACGAYNLTVPATP